jgi:tetraacyldisaccharide 4'-kinase
MTSFADRLQRIWYSGEPVPPWLGALEWLYAAGLRVRRLGYAVGLKRSIGLPVPVVVVGNLTVGGTGKTPLTIWLARELASRGWKPGVILRGYGGSAREALRVTAQTPASRCGDEALVIERATNLPVAVAARRAHAGSLLVKQDGCDVLIADDGLQHWGLARDLEIAVLDGARRFGNGRLLPAGPLREPVERLARVDFVVANGTPRPGEIAMRVRGERALSLSSPGLTAPLASFAGKRVHALAGIGNPERFFAMLESGGMIVERHPLADHHQYTGAELAFDDALPVLMTEKDAVKCAALVGEREAWVVPVEAELPVAFADQVHAMLSAIAGREAG